MLMVMENTVTTELVHTRCHWWSLHPYLTGRQSNKVEKYGHCAEWPPSPPPFILRLHCTTSQFNVKRHRVYISHLFWSPKTPIPSQICSRSNLTCKFYLLWWIWCHWEPIVPPTPFIHFTSFGVPDSESSSLYPNEVLCQFGTPFIIMSPPNCTEIMAGLVVGCWSVVGLATTWHATYLGKSYDS
jgi:hypothetical protein